MSNSSANSYWKANIRLVLSLLSVWFFISFGCGILFVDALDTIRFGGFKLGFWIAQQGSIFVFVALILIYIRAMDKLDSKYDLDASNESAKSAQEESQ
ncbi:MAG: putative solute:sodium symporter small subunit [Pseudohongiellaceae bacterium]|jgi:putative solute:sodium symporter small subunit